MSVGSGTELLRSEDVVKSNLPVHSFSIRTLQNVATWIAESRMIKGVNRPEEAFGLLLLCQAKGEHIGNALIRYHVIDGIPSMKSEAMLAEFQARGGKCHWIRTDDEEAEAEFSHPRNQPTPIRIKRNLKKMVASGKAKEWSKKKSEFVVKKSYRDNPEEMLRWRVVSSAVRMIDPGAILGTYSGDEIEDMRNQEGGTNRPEIIDAEFSEPEVQRNSTTDLPTRAAVNAAFAPKSAEPPPSRFPSKETTALPRQKISAKGTDSRPWPTIVSDEALGLNQEIATKCEADGLDPFEAINGHQIVNHMASAVIAADQKAEEWFTREKEGKRVRVGEGKVSSELAAIYGDGWREWIRAELAEYLATKRADALGRITNEVHGDNGIAPGPEHDNQEPATPPENDNQDIAVTGGPVNPGDAYEGP